MWQVHKYVYIRIVGCPGVVLAVVSHGGLLLTTNQITPGSLMSFLAASQTIQRYVSTQIVIVRLCMHVRTVCM